MQTYKHSQMNTFQISNLNIWHIFSNIMNSAICISYCDCLSIECSLLSLYSVVYRLNKHDLISRLRRTRSCSYSVWLGQISVVYFFLLRNSFMKDQWHCYSYCIQLLYTKMKYRNANNGSWLFYLSCLVFFCTANCFESVLQCLNMCLNIMLENETDFEFVFSHFLLLKKVLKINK